MTFSPEFEALQKSIRIKQAANDTCLRNWINQQELLFHYRREANR